MDIKHNTIKNFVSNEIGTLRKILIHSPDSGIGKILPSKFKDWLYDDTVHLEKMRKEYDEYVRLLLYFLDPEKTQYVSADISDTLILLSSSKLSRARGGSHCMSCPLNRDVVEI